MKVVKPVRVLINHLGLQAKADPTPAATGQPPLPISADDTLVTLAKSPRHYFSTVPRPNLQEVEVCERLLTKMSMKLASSAKLFPCPERLSPEGFAECHHDVGVWGA